MATGVVVLAFSYAQDDALEAVRREMEVVDRLFKQLVNLCNPLPYWQVRQSDIEDVFARRGHDIRIFHFAGHAGPSELQLNQDEFRARITFSEGLAAYIGQQASQLKLVFLNGCSTEDQAADFLKQGVSAVIATTLPVSDSLAYAFASRFYHEFTRAGTVATLQQAFRQALASITASHGSLRDPATGELHAHWLDETVRAGRPVATTRLAAELYTLHLSSPAVGEETFGDWMRSPAGGRPAAAASLRHKDGYLLCDRSREEEKFRELVRQKIDGQRPEPLFVCIHENFEHLPHLLPERFRLFELPRWEQRELGFETLELPLPADFGAGSIDDPQNPERDRFKIRLSEIYHQRFGGQRATDNRLCCLQPRPVAERLLVIHHELAPRRWQGQAAAETAEWQQRLRRLLDWYTGDYAAELQQFSSRLLIIFTAYYRNPDGFLGELLAELALRRAGQVFDWKELPNITQDDIDDWQASFLGDPSRTFLDPAELLGGEYERPLRYVKNLLEQEIERYNREKYGAS
jgi:hypothetical protein